MGLGPSIGYTLPEVLECTDVVLLTPQLSTSAGMPGLKDIIVKVTNPCNSHYRVMIGYLVWRLDGWVVRWLGG